ncbi:MAG TPA: hypothetical protein VEK57_08000 [Thermoanaerobaculia bacterium]|nr:hypothetical protein [Thermoanaerobaculia bacterium]
MTALRVAAIVEGHAEAKSAVRELVTRVSTELLGADYVNVLHPIRHPRSKLVQPASLLRAVDLAQLLLQQAAPADRSLILILFDADEDRPCILAPALLNMLQKERSHLDIALVLPNPEFETWFAAAAESLTQFFDLSVVAPAADPETARQRKGTVSRWMHGRYGETADQVRLTHAMDLNLCRSRSGSFDKLCRELERRLHGLPAINTTPPS